MPGRPPEKTEKARACKVNRRPETAQDGSDMRGTALITQTTAPSPWLSGRWATSNADMRWLAPTWTAFPSGSSPPPSLQPGKALRRLPQPASTRAAGWGATIRPEASSMVLSLMTGHRTEGLRALQWNEVDLDAGAVAVYRAARVTGDAKTRQSRRVLGLPQPTVQALREHHKLQAADRLKAGSLWQDHGLVFASSIGTPLDRRNVLREFRKITEAAGLGTDWVPRELRHTFVSLHSSDGMPLEDIADLVGHKRTLTTETVYRKLIVPELRRGAEVMDRLFR